MAHSQFPYTWYRWHIEITTSSFFLNAYTVYNLFTIAFALLLCRWL
jgi:hypothetical protein